MAELHTFAEGEMPPHLACQVMSFIRIQWPWVFQGEERYNVELGWPAEYDARYFALVERSALIAYASIIRRDLAHAGNHYKVAGLSSVFTYPQYRGEGFGRRIVGAVGDYLRQSDFDCAVLFCEPSMELFYAHHGWSVLPAGTLVGDRANPNPVSEPEHPVSSMFLPLSPQAEAARQDFERQPLYVRDHTW